MTEPSAIDALFADVCDLLGEDEVNNTFDTKPKVQTIDERIKVLEEYALTILDVEGFDPKTDYIRFRKIRLIKLKRVHSLLVDVIKDHRRYTAALKKRISTGERDPKKWVLDVNEAVEIALSSKPVALCAVENRIEDYARGRFEIFFSDDRCLDKGVVFVWGDNVADCRGPAKNILKIWEMLDKGETEGLEIQYATAREKADEPETNEDGTRRDVVQDDQLMLQEGCEDHGDGQSSQFSDEEGEN